MKKSIMVLAIIFVVSIFVFSGNALATYSIVAVDTLTGEIGCAGGSCIAGSNMIHDIIEGVGGIMTQAYYLPTNQDNAHDRMVEGMTPSEIITWLDANDNEGDPSIRQYGIVTLAGSGASAAYTGSLTDYWNGHLTGSGYSIQGNILKGSEIITGMETAFLTTDGQLEDKLFAALEAANVPGADIRCLSCNKPVISVFIKVIRTGDGTTPYLYENVNNSNCATNPMDGLREKFNAWKETKIADPGLSTIEVLPRVYFLANFNTSFSADISVTPKNSQNNMPTDGMEVSLSNTGDGQLSAVTDNGDGTFSANIPILLMPAGEDTIKAYVTAGGQVVELSQKPVLHYINCGDANDDGNTNLGDGIYIINYIFKGGLPPVFMPAGDANCDGSVNLGDAINLINYIFKGGPSPCSSCP